MARSKAINVKIATAKVIKALETALAKLEKDYSAQEANEAKFSKQHEAWKKEIAKWAIANFAKAENLRTGYRSWNNTLNVDFDIVTKEGPFPAEPAIIVSHAGLALDRRLALDQHALHDALLAHRIVDRHAMHRGAVVPHHDITLAPHMAVMMLGLARFVGKFVEQGVAFRAWQADDAIQPVRVKVKPFAARHRVGAHERMLDIGRLGDFLWRARRRAVARTRRVVAVDRAFAVNAALGRFRQGVVHRVHIAEPGGAAAT